MGKSLFAALIIAIALGTQSAAQANLLTNPSFESASLAGWTAEWGAGNQNVSGANPKNGLINARNYYDGGLYQNVSITGGQQYRLTGWAYVPVGGSVTDLWGSYIGLKFFNASLGELVNYQTEVHLLPRAQYNMADTGWVTAPATAVTAQVRFGTWQSGVTPAKPTDFDNFDLETQSITITPVIPEPTSLLLLGAGLIGLVGLTKKRKA